MKKDLLYSTLAAAAVTAVALLSGGCGSGSGGAMSAALPSGSSSVSAESTGRAAIVVKWPARTTSSKLIPVASNSVVITLTFNGKTVGQQTLARPSTGNTSTATFPALPVGQIGVVATADPTVNGTGTPQASGKGTLTVVSNQQSNLAITMGSTIVKLVIAYTGANPLPIGGTATADVEALDASNAMVLVSPQTISWASSDSTVLAVTPDTADTGVALSGAASGNANLTVTETESGTSASLLVQVRGPLANLTVTASNPQISVGGYMQLTIAASDSSGNSITAPTGLTFMSSNPQVAAVSNVGLVAGLRAGPSMANPDAMATITASAGGLNAPVTVTVIPATGGAAILSPTVVTVTRSTTQKFIVNVGTTIEQNVAWSLLDPNSLGAAQGFINGNGVYTAPAVPPAVNGLPVSVTVQAVYKGTTYTSAVTVQ